MLDTAHTIATQYLIHDKLTGHTLSAVDHLVAGKLREKGTRIPHRICGKSGYVIPAVSAKIYGLPKKTHTAHRLAYFLEYGSFPIEMDHINGVRHDNRWSNIRPCTHAENMQNLSIRSSRGGVFRGVSFHRYVTGSEEECYAFLEAKRKELPFFTGRFN